MTELDKQEARQGIPIHRMRYVLAASIALVVVLFAVIVLSWA
jgi:hypothetical protein